MTLREMEPEQINLIGRSVAGNIRARRMKRHFTQMDVAVRLGISQNAYSKMELGYTQLTLERLFVLADLLDCDITELVRLPGRP